MLSRRKLRKFLSKRQQGNVIDLTAMIDVVFILLLFFVLTSNVAQNIFDIELPKADSSYTEEGEAASFLEIRLTLFSNGEFAIESGKIQNFEAFKAEILKIYNKNPQAKFLIVSESTLPVQTLMELLTFLKAQKITKIDILLQK